jgi:hypothetical protein
VLVEEAEKLGVLASDIAHLTILSPRPWTRSLPGAGRPELGQYDA